jgi:hypothetical protein
VIALFNLRDACGLGRGQLTMLASLVVVAALSVAAPAAAAECPNEALRASDPHQLPDCRAYEQVTEIDKNGGDASGLPEFVQASANGEAFTYYTQAGFPNGQGSQDYPWFLAARNATSWVSQGLLPPQRLGPIGTVLDISENAQYAVTEVRNPGVGEGTGGALFLEDTSTGELTTIVPYNTEIFSFKIDDVLSDGSKVFFETNGRLAAGAGFGPKLYVWERATGQVSLAGLEYESTESPEEGAFGGPYSWFYRELFEGGATSGLLTSALHAVDKSGSQIYYTTAGTGRLLLRKGIGTSSPTTDFVSQSEKTNGSGPGGTDPFGPKPAAFMEATPDGLYAFFVSAEELTNSATTGTEDQGADLYRYDASTGELVDLAPDTTDANGAEVQGVLGASENGEVVYFAANGVLATRATPGNCSSLNPTNEPGECNLYVYEEGPGGGTIKFISRLALGGDVRLSDSVDISPNSKAVSGEPIVKGARVSADGDTLLFSSILPLTGYTAESAHCFGANSGKCAELFRYSATNAELTCISCDPNGTAPVGAAQLASPTINAFASGRGTRTPVVTRNLSASGDRIFFETPDALVEGDINGKAGCAFAENEPFSNGSCQDAYQWEAPGVGSCQVTAGPAGCLYLLSTGEGANAAHFGDADVDGNNAFIFTESKLVPTDRDSLYDVYDARVDGGLPGQHVLPPATCTNGEVCRGQTAPGPKSEEPGTSSFVGPGNTYQKVPCQGKKKCKKKHPKKHKKAKHKKAKHKKHKKKNKASKKNHGQAGKAVAGIQLTGKEERGGSE